VEEKRRQKGGDYFARKPGTNVMHPFLGTGEEKFSQDNTSKIFGHGGKKGDLRCNKEAGGRCRKRNGQYLEIKLRKITFESITGGWAGRITNGARKGGGRRKWVVWSENGNMEHKMDLLRAQNCGQLRKRGTAHGSKWLLPDCLRTKKDQRKIPPDNLTGTEFHPRFPTNDKGANIDQPSKTNETKRRKKLLLRVMRREKDEGLRQDRRRKRNA